MEDSKVAVSQSQGCEGATISLVVQNSCLERLDAYIAGRVEAKLSRSRVQALIEEGRVTINGEVVSKPSAKVKTGDAIRVLIPPTKKWDVEAESIPLDIIYEDCDVLVINKPRGMVVHPAAGHWEGTLVNAVLGHCPEIAGIGGETRPGIVHRLDKDTTGLLVVAKNELALKVLQGQMKARKVKREYVALCKGRFRADGGTIDAPIGRHPVDRKRMAVMKPGLGHENLSKSRAREAVTDWRVIARFGSAYTIITARLHTGRTHQIRVHMSYIGHPVAGDSVYGKAGRELDLAGQALHAFKLGLFIGDNYSEYREFTAPLPEDFRQLLVSLKNKYGEEIPSWLMI